MAQFASWTTLLMFAAAIIVSNISLALLYMSNTGRSSASSVTPLQTAMHDAAQKPPRLTALQPAAALQAASQPEHPGQRHWHAVPIVTLTDGPRFQELRELVGSIHYFRSDNLDVPLITVFGWNLSVRQKREIGIWRNVELQDFSETLFLGPRGVPILPAENVSVAKEDMNAGVYSLPVLATALSVVLRKYGSAVYVDTSLRFVMGGDEGGKGNQLFANLEKLIVEGTEGAVVLQLEETPLGGDDADGFAPKAFALRSGSEFANYFVDFELQCARGYQCPSTARSALRRRQRMLLEQLSRPAMTFGLSKQRPADSLFCFMLLRDDILYSEIMVNNHLPNTSSAITSAHTGLPPVSSVEGVRRKRIALLVATLTLADLQSTAEVAVLRLLLPSMLATISAEDIKRFEIVVYIGFDEEDRFWDDPLLRRELDGRMKRMIFETGVPERNIAPLSPDKAFVHFRYVRIPFSKGWVTHVWNSLFIKAYHDGCDFFFQINDDCTFESAGWLSAVTAPLSAPPADPSTHPAGFGVVGPWDTVHAGQLFTQAVVSRIHYEIFGRLYPIDIKDWYSDNWMTDVYAGLGKQVAKSAVVKNWNDKGTRYNVCSHPRYGEVMSRSQSIVQRYLNAWRTSRDGNVTDRLEDVRILGVEIIV